MKIDHWKLPHFFTKKLTIWIFLSKIWPVKADSFLSMLLSTKKKQQLEICPHLQLGLHKVCDYGNSTKLNLVLNIRTEKTKSQSLILEPNH